MSPNWMSCMYMHILEFVKGCTLCCGNDDEAMLTLVSQRKGVLRDVTGWCYGCTYMCTYYVHVYTFTSRRHVAYLDKKYSTVRCSDCELLVPPEQGGALQCARCQVYQATLQALMSWFNRRRPREDDRTDPSSHTPFQHLSTLEKVRRYQREHDLRRSCQRHIARLQESLERAIAKRGLMAEESLHDDLCQIMKQSARDVAQSHPPGSFAHIFWENQQRPSSVTDVRNMWWDPLMVWWCLYLRHLSSSAYEVVRESGIIKLLSQRTLRDYTHHTKVIIRFSKDVDKQVVAAANLDSCEERESMCC